MEVMTTTTTSAMSRLGVITAWIFGVLGTTIIVIFGLGAAIGGEMVGRGIAYLMMAMLAVSPVVTLVWVLRRHRARSGGTVTSK